MYTHIDQATFDSFNEYWNKYYPLLPPLPAILHNYEDGKAAVFNTWLRNSKLYEKVFIKPEKFFTHNLVEQISQKFAALLHPETKDYLLHKMLDDQFHFLLSYYLTLDILQHIEDFLATPKYTYLKEYIQEDYYASSNDDFELDHPIFYFIKQINIHYIHSQITSPLVQQFYKDAIYKSEALIEEIAKNKTNEQL